MISAASRSNWLIDKWGDADGIKGIVEPPLPSGPTAAPLTASDRLFELRPLPDLNDDDSDTDGDSVVVLAST